MKTIRVINENNEIGFLNIPKDQTVKEYLNRLPVNFIRIECLNGKRVLVNKLKLKLI